MMSTLSDGVFSQKTISFLSSLYVIIQVYISSHPHLSPSRQISGLYLFPPLQCLSLLILELYAGSGQLSQNDPLTLWMGFTHQVCESHSCKLYAMLSHFSRVRLCATP